MSLLHIEHGVADLDAWLEVFDRFQPQREAAGVREVRVSRPADGSRRVLIDLTFETDAAAEDFRTFLRETVWTSAEATQVMSGNPTAIVLTELRP